MQQYKQRTQPNRMKELWIGVAKNKRLPILNSDIIKTAAGLKITNRIARVDNFMIEDVAPTGTMADIPMPIRAFEMKAKMAVSLMAKDQLDCVIIGRDTSKEFNLASRGQKGLMQSVELLDMDLSRCVFTVAVKDNDSAVKPNDLNGRTVVTQYPEMLKSWARRNRVTFAKIISGNDILGGIEGYYNIDPSVTVIADLVQSGESLVNNGWKPLGMKQTDWDIIANNQDKKFIDFTSQKLQSISGVVMESSAIFARNSLKLSADKENTLSILQKRFEIGARAYGANPKPQFKVVAFQQAQQPVRLPTDIFRPSPRQAAALGL